MRLEDKEKIIFKVHPHWLYVAAPESSILGPDSSSLMSG